MTTPILALAELAAAQSQPEVIVNAALRKLEALVQLSIVDRDLTAPPGSPTEGARYIVAASPTGAWAGQAGAVATYTNAAWTFATPIEGWLAYAQDENALVYFDGSDWQVLETGGGSARSSQFYGVLSRPSDSAAISPSDGDQYLVAPVGANDFNAQDNKIAIREGGAWSFVTAGPGWLVYSLADAAFYVFESGAWSELELGGGGGTNYATGFDFPADPDLVNPVGCGFSLLESGTGAEATYSSEGNRPGIVTLDPGTTDGNHVGIILSPDAAVDHAVIQADAGFEFLAHVNRTGFSASGTDYIEARVGIFPSLGASRNSGGLYFYTRGDGAVLRWSVHCAGTDQDLSDAVTGWQTLEIVYNSADSDFDFKIDGVVVASLGNFGPPIAGTIAAQVAKVGGSNLDGLAVDFLRARGTFGSARW